MPYSRLGVALFLEPAVGCASKRNLKPMVSKRAIHIPIEIVPTDILNNLDRLGSHTNSIIFIFIYLYPCRTSCPKSSTCFFFSDISIFRIRPPAIGVGVACMQGPCSAVPDIRSIR